MAGKPEPTNEWYAVAKIAGSKMAEAYSIEGDMRCNVLVPCNLYGPGDNFDLDSSHVIPALLRKFHEAKLSESGEVELWGTGSPVREFLHADDMAAACVHTMDGNLDHVYANVGTGQAISITELARMVAEVVGFDGGVAWNGELDGHPHKTLDSARIESSGWKASIGLEEGLRSTYDWMVQNFEALRELSHAQAPTVAN